MDNLKDDVYYVKRMLKDIGFIIENTSGKDLDVLKGNELLCDSIMFRLIQISENSIKLTSEFKARNMDIPWQAIKGLRNRIVHDYGEVELDIVYQTVTEDIPDICKKLEDALTALTI
ncbi:MAG: DUF86 domain-containing protein [Clostridia bacterium]|nr:DUF86 domain-containing protein [Clostridia bacterium]